MTNQHPIIPPDNLVSDWARYQNKTGNPQALWRRISTLAAQWGADWGADQELEACCEWVSKYSPYFGDYPMPEDKLRAARRPMPTSLKEQALHELADVYDKDKIDDFAYTTIRRALEALND